MRGGGGEREKWREGGYYGGRYNKKSDKGDLNENCEGKWCGGRNEIEIDRRHEDVEDKNGRQIN